MSKGWLTIVTSLFFAGLIPFLFSAAKSSGWLPQHHTPTFLPFIFAIELIPELFHVSSVMPERAKTYGVIKKTPSGAVDYHWADVALDQLKKAHVDVFGNKYKPATVHVTYQGK